MLEDGPLLPICLECSVCTPGCSKVAGELPSTLRESMQQRQRDLLGGPSASAAGRAGKAAGPHTNSVPVPRQCWHCAQAPCMEACPAGAMRRDPGSGRVWVERSRCVGCWMCVLACPFGAVVPSADGHFAMKCDGCLGRATPACAGSCHPRDAFLKPELRMEAVRERRAGFAAAGWGWPGPASYPPAHANPRSIQQPVLAGPPRRYLIVGAGIAALRAVETIRALDARGRIVVVSEETAPPYSRVLLSHHIAGLRDEPSLALRSEGWAGEVAAEIVAGDGAVGLDVDGRQVRLRSGRLLDYDRLLIATGANPVRLPVPGIRLEGVVSLRNLADSVAIRSMPHAEAVVVGGGFIGVKAAEALRQLGARVAIVEKLGQLLPQMLDGPAAEMVQASLEAKGVRVLTGVGVREIKGRDRASAVLLESGERLGCDLVVVGVGVTPNVAWLRGSPVQMGRGVIVDERMSSSVPDVWAAGDVAEVRDILTGERAVNALWPLAAAQGRTAGANMAGGFEQFAGSLPMNTLDLFGLPVASFGQVRGEEERVVEHSPARYQKRVHLAGSLVGAVLVGDIQDAGRLLAEVYRRHQDRGLRTEG